MRLTINIILRPMKKKTGVVAGIAQKSGGKDGAVGYGLTGDNGDVRPSPKFPPTFFSYPSPSFPSAPPHRLISHQYSTLGFIYSILDCMIIL